MMMIARVRHSNHIRQLVAHETGIGKFKFQVATSPTACQWLGLANQCIANVLRSNTFKFDIELEASSLVASSPSPGPGSCRFADCDCRMQFVATHRLHWQCTIFFILGTGKWPSSFVCAAAAGAESASTALANSVAITSDSFIFLYNTY